VRTTLRCKRCGTSLIVEGPGSRAPVIARPVTCPKCQHTNETQWPSDGHYKVTVEGTGTADG